MTLIERLRADADICQAISRVDPLAMVQSANALRNAARALEAADAMADELKWATRQIAPHKIMCIAVNGPVCTCDRPQRIKQAIQALAAYRAATKGEG